MARRQQPMALAPERAPEPNAARAAAAKVERVVETAATVLGQMALGQHDRARESARLLRQTVDELAGYLARL